MIQRHVIIVPVAIAANCNQVAAWIGIDPEAMLNTLSVPLVPSAGADAATATHWAASGCMTEEQRSYLESNQEAFPGAMWWRYHDTGPQRSQLVASHDGQHLGEMWSWETCLSHAGLKRQIIPFL